ncbi:helix-turn-helix transcriptional regulator [Nitriliruptoraceae bacterium ZYF776]|nr:helix-turn-helix transcriptional regulator [Profundirhabdus halotolerans]
MEPGPAPTSPRSPHVGDATAAPADGGVSRAEFAALHAEVAALHAEVAALRDGGAATGPDTAPATRHAGGGLWALDGLRDRLEDPAGGVLFTGAVELEPGVPHLWQQGATTESLLATPWGELAPALDALAHPVRLHLLQLVADGTERTADLAAADGVGTSGQLHHHLRQLVAAGWLRQAGRGRYEVPAPRVVPLLVVLAAVAG